MKIFACCWLIVILVSCESNTRSANHGNTTDDDSSSKKINIYQAFTRVWGNADTSQVKWGTIADNGVGKFDDFTDAALDSIKSLGITHIWFTGILHHAVINNYSSIGVGDDDPDVVKGRAGSPYAVKDYYNVNPDLAIDPNKRLEEFKALIDRTHAHGLKLIIDIVPNHVARNYHTLIKPDSVSDFGADDDTSFAYKRDNNFYYIPGEKFKVPQHTDGYKPLGGEAHPLSDGLYNEDPARWTGNGSRLAQPKPDDWYETIKINYGVSPEGKREFDTLANDYSSKNIDEHYRFWQGRNVPSSWKKFRDIALYWLDLGVDGFRFDMAEMVPVEFWSFMNSAIKHANPNAVLVAEVYNPAEYRNYIRKGKMDYLYDKVGLYDSLKYIIQQKSNTDMLDEVLGRTADIEKHMLHFLENHDEQRIASPAFAGNAYYALPALVLSATATTSPTLIYFGQEVGEPGNIDAGFGKPTRTSIFDYSIAPHHQRWMNNKKFDGGALSDSMRQLRNYYQLLLNFTKQSNALTGKFISLHEANRKISSGYHNMMYSFIRWQGDDKLIVVNNFSRTQAFNGEIMLDDSVLVKTGITSGSLILKDVFTGKNYKLNAGTKKATLAVQLEPLQSLVLKF